jgi:hypothetical protein
MVINKIIMKSIRKVLPFMFFLISTTCIMQLATAQKPPTEKEVAVKNAVDSQRYIFYAQYANPQGARQKYLTSEYTVRISKDTIKADLPYFGRAYSATYGSTEGGINFTTTDFDYKIEARKKGGWEIALKPKDIQGGQQMTIAIFTNGTATLQATSNNRQPISFNGYVEPFKQKK